MTSPSSPALPPVAADVAAGALELLPQRLRKRIDPAVAKASGWPVEATHDGVRVRVDADTSVTLKVTDGIVARPEDAVCDCLLSPACLHRAALLSSAPLAETGAAVEQTAGASPRPDTAPDEPHTTPDEPDAAAVPEKPDAAAAPKEPDAPDGGVQPLTAAQQSALAGLRRAATGVLVAGVAGGGAVQRVELLHAAHSARIAGLPLPAAAAVRIARRLDEARSGDPGFRLSELSAELAGLLGLLRHPGDAVTPARRAYRPAKPLRLHGLFTEPVVTASGYAGATGYALAPDGGLRTLSDIAPGGPERAAAAALSPVPGGCALSLREWGDGGAVILTDPTVSPEGRIGGGARLRSVRAPGAAWHEPPLDALWQKPPADQLASALDWLHLPADDRPAGGDLLFLSGVMTGQGGFAVTGGPTLRLLAPDERPELPYAENLRLLGSYPGLALRLAGRVVPDRPDGIRALAAAWRGHDGGTVRVDLGLRRVHRTDVPAPAAVFAPCAPPPALPVELDLLRRAVHRAVAGGRAVTAAAADGELPRRLRAVGLATGADCARALAAAAAERRHDALGRLLPGDPDAFATAWLAAAVYVSAAAGSLLAAAWSAAGPEASQTRSGPAGAQP
ncbi:hypothetical protein [Streptomyces sp. NPDC002187]|uniref:hypothetical protein n=1 Tax=Streptomyces sp. NPDC002187 TaxID=3364637 RepID=UPI0036B6D921